MTCLVATRSDLLQLLGHRTSFCNNLVKYVRLWSLDGIRWNIVNKPMLFEELTIGAAFAMLLLLWLIL